MYRLKRDSVIYEMSKNNEPVLYINPGDKIIVETEDCFGHKITSEDQRLGEDFDFSKVNPATGPIYIRNAKPGDSVVIEIKRIELDTHGVVELYPGFGLLGDNIYESRTKVLRIESNHAIFDTMQLDLKPMIGVIGVAPLQGAVPCGIPGAHGGNLDTVEITVGSVVKLPVFVDGALLALGDVHALMGQGEVCGTGVETRALIEIEVTLDANYHINEPIVETSEAIYFLSSNENLDLAIKNATKYAVSHISEKRKLSFEEAYMLSSIVCDLQISQVVNPLKTVKMKVPKSVL